MERVGFIGLGIMGRPMARNILQAGYPLTVYNRSQAAMEDLAATGARLANSPEQVAQQADVVITCLPDSPDVESVVLGASGILEGAQAGSIYIDMSTIAPATSRKIYTALQTKGIQALDAPVSGGDVGAQQGTLSIMVGGSEVAFQRALPLLQTMGKNIVYIGAAGAGQVAKACNQIVVALTVQAVAEALTLATASGVDPARVRAALLGGFAQSRVLDLHGQRMLEHQFDPGFKLDLFRKDLEIVQQTARELKLSLFGVGQATMLMNAMLALGKGEQDYSGVIQLYEKLSNGESP